MSTRVGITTSNLDTVPSLCNAVDLLAEAGYQVDVFTNMGPDFFMPGFDRDSVDLVLGSWCEKVVWGS